MTFRRCPRSGALPRRALGFTLIELTLSLALLGLLLGLAFPALQRHGDRLAVRAAREALAGTVETARAGGASRGLAELAVVTDSALVRVRIHDREVRVLRMDREFGVSLGLGGGQPHARLAFGRLALGRMASRTFILTRGADTARLSVSSLGRVRRW